MPKNANNKMDADSDPDSNDEIETNDDDNETFFSRELSTVSFKDMLTMQANLGTKVFNATAFKNSKDKLQKVGPSTISPWKAGKNKPQEVSSKVRPKFSVKAPRVTQPVFRDPRFDSSAGEFSKAHFENSYAFVNDIRQEEAQKVKKLLKKEKNPHEKKKLENLLKSMNDREKSRQQKLVEREREKEMLKEEKEKILRGKAPFYLKSSVKKKMEKEERMKSLEERGKLKKYLVSKEKKKLAKEGRHVVNL